MTALAEIKVEERGKVGNTDFYEDEYFVRLTRKPTHSVTIDIDSIAVASDRPSAFIPSYRNFSRRKQVYVNDLLATSITFTDSDWFVEKRIKVSAIDDDLEEGVDLLNFASQPSSLVRESYA